MKNTKETETDKDKRRGLLRDDQAAQKHIQEAARAYVLALAYAQLLSPRSSILTVIYDLLYENIKGFNLSELEDFYA
ncbi:MAG: hypothetical protein J0653_03710, partial [Deltaproteobacteria bacterium]|nr:hypothetical protein [Deltaproteobacteria bacterium]